MRVVITGSSGLIGTALCGALRQDGHDVVRLVRRPAQAADERQWDLDNPDPRLVERTDVVVNLAASPIGDRRWNADYRAVIADSRIGAATALATMVAKADKPPALLISMSGIRYYGVDRGDEELTEASYPRDKGGFLPQVMYRWEAAARPPANSRVRVCTLRTGIVLSPAGGVLPRLIPPFRSGFGAILGSPRAYWSFLSLHDAVSAILFLTTHPNAEGPYNLSAPKPARAAEFTRALSSAVGRPAALWLPRWALRIGLGQVSTEALGSLRVLPERLEQAGFQFRDRDIETALSSVLR
jgi:uncharacterized protein (TIGR01777 family)